MINLKSLFFPILFIFLFISTELNSQYALPFLLEAPDGRYTGMGSAGTAVADDIYATYYNPAALGFLHKTKISEKRSVNYFEAAESYHNRLNSNFSDMFYSTTAGAYRFGNVGTFALDFSYFNIGKFTRTFEDGRVAGVYNASEIGIGLAYGKDVSEELSLGIKAKYVQSNLQPVALYSHDADGVASSVAFDFAVLWIPDFPEMDILDKRFLSLGLNLQNIGPKLTYANESDPLPTNIRFGVGFKLLNNANHKLLLTTDIQKILVKRDSLGSDPLPKSLITSWTNESGFVYSFGAEYWLKRYFAARSGIFYEPEKSGNRQFFTFGVSGRVYIFQADFAYLIPLTNIDTSLDRFKLTLRVGGY